MVVHLLLLKCSMPKELPDFWAKYVCGKICSKKLKENGPIWSHWWQHFPYVNECCTLVCCKISLQGSRASVCLVLTIDLYVWSRFALTAPAYLLRRLWSNVYTNENVFSVTKFSQCQSFEVDLMSIYQLHHDHSLAKSITWVRRAVFEILLLSNLQRKI